MAGEAGFGMEKGQLKALLIKSKQEPVSCAIGKGKEAGSAYILLDNIKQPKALETALEKQFPDIKDPRRGTASVDVDANPKLVVFRLNRPASGLAVRMLKLVKQVGFSKVKFEYEDGSEAEGLGDEEEEGAESGSEEIATSSSAVPPPPPPPPPSAPQIDAKALKERLTALVQRMAQVIGADPSRKDALMALAKQAQLMLGTNNLISATQSADQLEAALASAPVTGARRQEAPPAAPAAGTGVAFQKMRLLWDGTRKNLMDQLKKLEASIVEMSAEEEDADEIRSNVTRVEEALATLDTRLSDALDDLYNAGGGDAALKQAARDIALGYQSFVAADPLMQELDKNPFVPLDARARLDTTLTSLISRL
jgi:hypothetical protein